MNDYAIVNSDAALGLAQRTCAQCKASKKKCDKILPKCSRCARLSVDCSYPDPERLNGSDHGNDTAGARFEEVFERLRRIEAHIFPPDPTAQNESSQQQPSLAHLAQSHGIENPNPINWALEPGTLKPAYQSLILWQSILATLDEHKASVNDVIRIYISTTDRWLPMVSSIKFQKELALYGELTSSDKFVLLVLAMHLLISSPAHHPPAASLAESPWYRRCKYHWSHFVAFREPNIELIQSGMLIAIFEFNHCVEDRALTTLGICCRLAFLLDFDEVMAKHSAQDLGKLSDEDEEIILTWMGLTRLERYFNMPPTIVPKAQCMPLHFDNDPLSGRASPYSGPSIARFSTLEPDELAHSIYEYDAAQRNGRVQKFIRDHRYAAVSPELYAKVMVVLKDLDDYVAVRRAQMERDGAWAGIHVALGAAIQIQCFYVAKNTCTLDEQTMRSMHSHIEQMSAIISRCRIFHGFEENYLDGIQPTWCSLPYHAISSYRLIEEADTEKTLPSIDMTLFVEVLQTMAPKYRLAARCLELLELPGVMSS
ncbi:hypothetical protein BU23DRAFT_61360 [Bimuria novae-zelandiae CBS 107.79]|uniref:Zn(2)-C6 fungal-type domain-containing protein n=1 Tax=Bimuria novae-zelandiae CBS 107.79 TaxID=1447943 RepID=A0A6A5UTU5_9PLEO|nr:hypothetical protein BU23DRAFT_61360 [Bimuria novae-zelandiae CBS 107.79]